MLTKEQIVSAIDLKVTPISIPEWGGEAFLRTPSERDYCAYVEIMRRTKEKNDYTNARSTLVAMMLCDDAGRLMFNWRVPGDLEVLNAKNPHVMDRIHDEGMKISGLHAESESPVKALEKNS